MKILVYNSQDQFALSRKQIEVIRTLLPKEYFEPIREFHLSTQTRGQELFEYIYETKIAYFEYLIKEKTQKTTENAVRILLIGLCRIKAKVKFGVSIKKNELENYLPFVEKWIPICLNAMKKAQ